jgi:C-terminal processing protease CtpA/Prc
MTTVGKLDTAERELVVDQALALIGELYVHLPLKRAMHATDPVQRLRLLKRRLRSLSERKFHDEMIDIFTDVRDLHTNYVLPDPYRAHTAFLPFELKECWEAEECNYVVSKLFGPSTDPNFQPGIRITHWNGVPMQRAVELNADRAAGSNLDARHARGLETMTVRPLAMMLPPDEHWAILTYQGTDNVAHEIRLDWQVFAPETGEAEALLAGLGDAKFALGIDYLMDSVRRAQKSLFAPEAVKVAAQMEAMLRGDSAGAGDVDLNQTSSMPDVLTFRTVPTADGRTVGYLRIWTFSVANVDLFLDEVIRILGLLPPDGLILDVRGNGGGIIMAGERLLQLFTPHRIEAERLHFFNTPATQVLAGRHPSLQPWKHSIDEAVETGAAFSQGFPIEQEGLTNGRGQHYFGPVVLITDARCYSTTDIFAAGFQDHKIGPILGTAGNTGAGGANVWSHDLLRELLAGTPNALKPLPKGASMRIAIRRTTRVKDNSGVVLEDLGVKPDEVHRLTRADIFEDNRDLIAHAAGMLRNQPARQLNAIRREQDATWQLQTRNIDRVDVFGDGRPVVSVDVNGQPVEVSVPHAPQALRLDGYFRTSLVARRTVPTT